MTLWLILLLAADATGTWTGRVPPVHLILEQKGMTLTGSVGQI